MKTLKISKDLALPIEAVTEKLAFLGRTGSGKTYAAQKVAEEMHAAGAQFVVIDPVGVWMGLRLAADGKSPGLPIPVLGGLRGDIPLEATAGALIADLVVDRGVSMVLDVSQFESDADKARFAQAFADRFYFRKKAAPSAIHVFIEECQEFVPQNHQRGDERMLHAFTRLVKIGRNFGIGVSLISQRPQEVNKKVLNLTELLFCFQLTGPQERKTIEGWIAEKGLDADIAGELPKLKVGHPHVWSPSWLEISKVIAIDRKTTADVSSTPKVGAAAVARDLSPIDLDRLRKDMAATIEKAKAEDPRVLRQRIAELEREARNKSTNKIPAARQKTVEVPAVSAALVARLEAAIRKADAAIERLGKVKDGTQEAINAIVGAAKPIADELKALRVGRTPEQRLLAAVTPRLERMPDGELARRTAATERVLRERRSASGPGDPGLPKGERAVLTAIAQHPDGVTREQLTILTGYKRSTRDAYVQRLRERGHLVDGERITATQAGVDALGADFEPLPTGDALREHWLRRLPEGERLVLQVLVGAYPKTVEREAISEATGYKRSTRDAYLQRLGARRLVTSDRDGVRAAEALFG
jgi:uncharacterized protein